MGSSKYHQELLGRPLASSVDLEATEKLGFHHGLSKFQKAETRNDGRSSTRDGTKHDEIANLEVPGQNEAGD